MKKIVRWLADITNVTSDIQGETAVYIGKHMQDYSYWFTGGILHEESLNSVRNILYLYPEKCLKQGTLHLIGSQFESLRSEIYKLDKEDIVVEHKSN